MWFLVFEVDEDLEDMMSVDEAILESKTNTYSRLLSRSFDVFMIMCFVSRQDENLEDVDEHNECEE